MRKPTLSSESRIYIQQTPFKVSLHGGPTQNSITLVLKTPLKGLHFVDPLGLGGWSCCWRSSSHTRQRTPHLDAQLFNLTALARPLPQCRSRSSVQTEGTQIRIRRISWTTVEVTCAERLGAQGRGGTQEGPKPFSWQMGVSQN